MMIGRNELVSLFFTRKFQDLCLWMKKIYILSPSSSASPTSSAQMIVYCPEVSTTATQFGLRKTSAHSCLLDFSITASMTHFGICTSTILFPYSSTSKTKTKSAS